MPWIRPFPMPIVLQDGRTFVTLADARAFIRSLPKHRQRAEQWQYAGGLLLEAATSRGALIRIASRFDFGALFIGFESRPRRRRPRLQTRQKRRRVI